MQRIVVLIVVLNFHTIFFIYPKACSVQLIFHYVNPPSQKGGIAYIWGKETLQSTEVCRRTMRPRDSDRLDQPRSSSSKFCCACAFWRPTGTPVSTNQSQRVHWDDSQWEEMYTNIANDSTSTTCFVTVAHKIIASIMSIVLTQNLQVLWNLSS